MPPRALVLPLSLALTTAPALARAGDLVELVPPTGVGVGSAKPIVALPALPARTRPREVPAAGGWRVDAALITAGQAADLMSTEAALSRCATCDEANRPIRSRTVRIGAKTATALGLTLACQQLRRDGHPRIARGVAIGAGVLGGAVAAHNLRTGRRN